MAHSAPLAFDADSDDQEVRSGFWRFAAPEYYTLGVILSVALATYIFVTGDAQSERLLTPALVAVIMIANLVPAMALIVLIGSRVARARAVRSMAGGNGRLHVRLVALFSLIASDLWLDAISVVRSGVTMPRRIDRPASMNSDASTMSTSPGVGICARIGFCPFAARMIST